MNATPIRQCRPQRSRSGSGQPGINNIEVIYDHVILVLKGVSLHVPKARSWPCWAPTAPARAPR
jgi:branched-chain amino acid transport system ATP-binding protein